MEMKQFEIAELLYKIGNTLERNKKKLRPLNIEGSVASSQKKRTENSPSTHDVEILIDTFAKFHLDEDSIYAIGFLWFQYFGKGDGAVSPSEIFSVFPLHNNNRFTLIQKLNQLVEKRFIRVAKKHQHNFDGDYLPVKLDIARLDTVVLRLHSNLINHVMNETPLISEERELTPFKNNEEYLASWLKYIEILTRISNEDYGEEERQINLEQLELLKEEIITKEKLSEAVTFPLRKLIQEYSLDNTEQIFLVYLLQDHIDNNQSNIDELLKLLSDDTFERMKNLKYFKPEGRLLRHRLIHIDNEKGFMSQSKNVTLQMAVVLRILENDSSNPQERLRRMIADSDLFTYRTPQKGMSDIILSDQVRNNLTTALKRYHADVYSTLESWGVYAKRSNQGEKHMPKLVMLFYGDPGVGKTLSAEGIAKELGKDLLITDCARVMSAWVGESQKNTSQIFQKYNELVDRLDNPPILLLNECDQLLSKRTEGNGNAADKMYHQMQNILLEGIENFRGILILTTNSCSSLDQAFSRRFDLKIEFKPPTEEERKLLWNLHLGKIPGATEVDIPLLAKEYNFSGGQIVVVIENAATEAASLPIEERMITTELLKAYSILELRGNFQRTGKNRIGF